MAKKQYRELRESMRRRVSYTRAGPVTIKYPNGTESKQKAYSPREMRNVARGRPPVDKVAHDQWKRIMARDNHECQYCGSQAQELDHVWPRWEGGGSEDDNLVAACRRCNQAKGPTFRRPRNFELLKQLRQERLEKLRKQLSGGPRTVPQAMGRRR